MRFTLTMSSHFIKQEDIEKYRSLGLVVGDDGYFEGWDDLPSIELNTIEDLVEFHVKWGDLVITSRMGSHVLEIYNGYRE